MTRTKRHDNRDGWYLITPADAQRWLDDQPQNRPENRGKCERFAEEMRGKRWLPNGETIILDEHGKLLDGQGRCRACVISGVPFESYVVFGVKRHMFPSVDSGAEPRTAGHLCALLGATNWNLVASVLKWSILIDQWKLSPSSSGVKSTITNAMILGAYRKQGDAVKTAIADMQTISSTWRALLVGYVPPSVLIYVYMRMRERSPEKALLFATGMITGESLKKGSPILTLRNRSMNTTGKILSYVHMACAIKAARAFLVGKELLNIRWDPSREQFPRLEDARAEREAA